MGQAKQRGSFLDRLADSEARHAAYRQRQFEEQRQRQRYAATVRHQTPQRISPEGTAVLPLTILTFTR